MEEAARFVGGWEDSYGHVWERDKDATLAAYAAANHPLATFEHDIQKFKDLAEEIRAETHTKHMLFLRVDCEPLVDAAARHCEQWRARYLELLNDQARADLFALYAYFESGSEACALPRALEQLADKVACPGGADAREETYVVRVLRAGTTLKFEFGRDARRAGEAGGWTRPGPARGCPQDGGFAGGAQGEPGTS